jgi:hypothetical protein
MRPRSGEDEWEKPHLDSASRLSGCAGFDGGLFVIDGLTDFFRGGASVNVAPVTTAFMRALPAAMRPNPYAIDEDVMRAAENGWSMSELARLSYCNERNPNPAFVVVNVRRLSQHPPTPTQPKPRWNHAHLPCDDPSHDPKCELCRCIPNEVHHHVSVPATDPGMRKVIGGS